MRGAVAHAGSPARPPLARTHNEQFGRSPNRHDPSPEQAGVRGVGIAGAQDSAHLVEDDVARSSQERSDLRSIAAVMGAVVMGAQGSLIAPDAEHHELARIVARENTELDAFQLGATGLGQLGEERAQFTREANTSVEVGHQHHFSGHCR
jgi:hypothetical protein